MLVTQFKLEILFIRAVIAIMQNQRKVASTVYEARQTLEGTCTCITRGVIYLMSQSSQCMYIFKAISSGVHCTYICNPLLQNMHFMVLFEYVGRNISVLTFKIPSSVLAFPSQLMPKHSFQYEHIVISQGKQLILNHVFVQVKWDLDDLLCLLDEDLSSIQLCALPMEMRNTAQFLASIGLMAYKVDSL